MVVNAFDDYLEFPDDRCKPIIAVLSLWTMFTYVYPTWPAVPYLYIGGTAGSGKSRVYELLERMVFRPFKTSNITAPSTFRTLHETGGTLLLDEVERIKSATPDAVELCSILLAGYKAGGTATRLTPETFESVQFDVFGPKALANIEGLPDALGTRTIPIIMSRSRDGSVKPMRRIDAEMDRWSDIRDALHELTLESFGFAALRLRDDHEACPLFNRDYELWHPLLAIARYIEADGIDELHETVLKFARETTERASAFRISDLDETVLRVLAAQIKAGKRPTLTELLNDVRESDYESFSRSNKRSIGDLLRRYSIYSVKNDGRREFGMSIDELRRLCLPYGIDVDAK